MTIVDNILHYGNTLYVTGMPEITIPFLLSLPSQNSQEPYIYVPEQSRFELYRIKHSPLSGIQDYNGLYYYMHQVTTPYGISIALECINLNERLEYTVCTELISFDRSVNSAMRLFGEKYILISFFYSDYHNIESGIINKLLFDTKTNEIIVIPRMASGHISFTDFMLDYNNFVFFYYEDMDERIKEFHYRKGLYIGQEKIAVLSMDDFINQCIIKKPFEKTNIIDVGKDKIRINPSLQVSDLLYYIKENILDHSKTLIQYDYRTGKRQECAFKYDKIKLINNEIYSINQIMNTEQRTFLLKSGYHRDGKIIKTEYYNFKDNLLLFKTENRIIYIDSNIYITQNFELTIEIIDIKTNNIIVSFYESWPYICSELGIIFIFKYPL